MIDIKIFDVEHGFCAIINTHDRHMTLIDCGYNSRLGFRPSQYIFQEHCLSLDCLVLPAYSSDHLENFSNLFNELLSHGLSIHSLVANPSVNPEQFPGLELPARRLGNQINLLEQRGIEGGKISQNMEIDEVNFSFFWNNYPDFQDAHNLSLITFISYRDLRIIFPSDMETKGWRGLLKYAEFRDLLKKVNIFVASDHGREEGYCPEVFDYCQPEVVIISNAHGQPASPSMMSLYESHTRKVSFGISDKKVLTTLEQGTITISKYLDRLLQVSTESLVKHH